jgi:hypothetical protein
MPTDELELKIMLQIIALLFLFTCNLFNDALNTSGHIASNDVSDSQLRIERM